MDFKKNKFTPLYSTSLIMLLGCQQPTMHIYHDGLNDIQRFQLKEQLDAQQIKYAFTELTTPEKYDAPHLVYFPGDVEQTYIENIEQIVRGLGYDSFNTKLFSQTGHYYTRGNLGLYFPSARSERVLPELLFANDCDQYDFQIHIKTNGKWSALNSKEDLTTHRLNWEFNTPFLTLKRYFSDGSYQQQVYQAESHQVLTLQGYKPAVTYKVMGHREYALSIFNCDLQAIFAD